MASNFFLLVLVLILSSCGQPVETRLNQIQGDPNNPDWAFVPENEMPKYPAYNIFSLSVYGKKLATGFILSNNSTYLITNAHVALGWKMLRRMNPSLALIGENRLNTLQVTKIITVDKKLDFALLEFRWQTQPKDLQNMILNISRLPEVGTAAYLLTNVKNSGRLVKSVGDIVGQNYLEKKKPSFHHLADTIPGMSGSPVFSMQKELVGIHFGTPKGSDYNRAIPILLIVERHPGLFNLK